jgi:signal transduction histidine kinase
LHPVLLYVQHLLCGICGVALAVVSWMANPHSVTWLVALYATVILLLSGFRRKERSELFRAYLLYLFFVVMYLLIVWFLHVEVPGPDPKQTATMLTSWVRIVGLIGTSMQIASYHFALKFSDERRPFFRWLNIIGWIIGIGFSLSNAAGVFIDGLFWSGTVWVPPVTGVYKAFFVYTTFYHFLSAAVPVIRLPLIESRQRRLQVIYFLLASVPLWISFWGHFLIGLGINIYPTGGIMFLIHAAILAYAVLKEKVFDITIYVRRGLAYAIFSLAIGLLFGASLWLLSAWSESLHATLASGFFFVLLAGLLYAPLLSYLQSAVDRVFFRETADRQHMIEQFAHEAASTIDLETLSRSICNLIERSIKPRRTSLYLDDGRGTMVHFGSQAGQYAPGQWPAGPRLPSEYATGNGSARLVRAPENNTAPYPIQFTEGDDALVVPITHRDQRLGCLLLEPKRADEPYDDEDVRLAQAIAAQSAVALQNARSFAQLERQQNLARVGEAISTLNHEIKNVLQPVRHQVDRLAELETSDPVVKRAMSIIPDRLAALDRLLSNLKDLSRPIELRIREIDLNELTAAVYRDIQELAVAKTVKFKTVIAPAQICQADGHWLRQVLYNLVRNSVEATTGRKNPEVTIETTSSHGQLKILVKDNGCGIDEAAQKKLFSLFYSTKGEGGTGLGLSISKKIIELHGGQIDISSQLGEGTCVRISLPPIDQPSSESP